MSSIPLTDAAGQILDTLRRADLNAHSDPRDLDPPCVWISPSRITPLTLDGRSCIEWEAYLIAPDTGDPLPHLEALATKATDALGPLTLTTTAITIANISPDPLPALTFTLETETTS